VTPYVALFIATLAPAVIVGMARGGDGAIVAVIVLASFLGAHLSWRSPDPVLTNAMSDLACAALIIVLCQARWAMGVAVLFLVAVACSVAHEVRGMSAYVHVISAIGHMQNVATIIGGVENGRRDRDAGRKIWALDYRN
jgi:hypothetical protein